MARAEYGLRTRRVPKTVFFKFIYFERERERERGNKLGEGQKKRERESQAALSAEPNAGLKPTTQETMM